MADTHTTPDAAMTGSPITYHSGHHIPLLPPYNVDPSCASHAYSTKSGNWPLLRQRPPVLLETMRQHAEILKMIESDDPVYVPEDADSKVSKECIQWCQQNLENISTILVPRKSQIPNPNFYASHDGEIKIQWCGKNDSLTLLINWEDSQAEFYHSDMPNDIATSETIPLNDEELWDRLRIKVVSVFCT